MADNEAPAANRYRFARRARSAATPEAVFQLLADATTWSSWAGPLIPSSSWDPAGPAGGVGAVRLLGRKPFLSRERIVACDPPRHLAYVLDAGLPVRSYRADVTVTPDGTGCRIEWTGVVEPRLPGTGRLLEAFLGTLVGDFARRLARAAPSGPEGPQGPEGPEGPKGMER